MKNQPPLKIGMIANHDVKIKDAHFHCEVLLISASPRLLLVACLILSFALGVVTGRDYLPVRYSPEDKPAMTEQQVDSQPLTIDASSAV